MSKTPLQLYRNERYNETVSGYVNKEWYHQQKRSRKHRSDTFNGRQPTFRQLLHSYTNSDLCLQGSQTIFKNYLREHKNSIEDYYNLQKQQKEILRLCKEKIAKKFPAQLAANLADEDVIRALKIAQNSESSHTEKCYSSDQVVDAILKFITSNHEQQELRKKKKSSEDNFVPIKTRSYEARTLPQNTTKRNSAFKKFFGVFKKSKAKPTIKQECNYVLRPRPKKEEPSSWSCPQVKRQDASGSDSAIESDTSFTSNDSKTKVLPIISPPPKGKHTHYVSKAPPETVVTKCTCHSQVKKITHDIKRQQTQIKEIQTTLRHCLTILKQMEQPHAKFAPDLNKKSKIRGKSTLPESNLNFPGKVEYHYRVENATNKPTTRESKSVQHKSDKSADEVKRVCCYKCKKKRKAINKGGKATADTATANTATADTVTAATSTTKSAVEKEKSKTTTIQVPTTVPTVTSTTTKAVSNEITDPTSAAFSLLDEEDADDDHKDDHQEDRPLTKKEKRLQMKKKKKEMKLEKKKQKQMAKLQKKRCCLIRLIKFICCSGCCT